jgi:putative transcriptional regulator
MSQEEITIIKNRIRDMRKLHELTQEALAEAVGISRQSIISLESGRCVPSVPVAIAISRFFEAPIEQLFIIEEDIPELPKNIAVDVYQTKREVIIEAEVPGITVDDININLDHNLLEVRIRK